MRIINLHQLLILLLAVLLHACGGKTKSIEVTTPTLELTAEGPLFEGANTATATWELDLQTLRQESGVEQAKLKEAKIKRITITLQDGEELPSLEKMVMELTSKNLSMTRVGLYEGKIEAGKAFELAVAQQQENLKAAFEDGKITFVGDFDLIDEEYWESLQFTLSVTFELGVSNS